MVRPFRTIVPAERLMSDGPGAVIGLGATR